jgi:hypothetical protein
MLAGAATATRELTRQKVPALEPATATPPSLSRMRRRTSDGLYGALLAEVGCLALVVLQVDLFLPAGWGSPFQLASGIALLVGGVTFLPTRIGARALLLERLAPAQYPRVRRRMWRRLLLDLLIQFAAFAMLIGAAIEMIRALPHYL